MNNKIYLCGIAVAVLPASARAGGDFYPLDIKSTHGTVMIRRDQPGSRWQRVKQGTFRLGTYLVRTNPHSFAHLGEVDKCVDANSLIRVKVHAGDELPTLTVLRGRVSAIDGK